jgi:cytochrome d ubiquinol oxidase subunit II
MINFWVAVLASSLLLYILLDGFDLGVGILFAFTRDERDRDRMLAAISPVWDGNETWLVLAGTVLFGAFPKVYAIALSAFYIPVLVGVGALILRGVAFEFRENSRSSRGLWNAAFCGGSTVAAFVQGAAVGGLVQGLPLVGGQYVGETFGWLTPFAVFCGISLCLGYTLLGAGWLVKKCEGDVCARAYRALPGLIVAVMISLTVIFLLSSANHLPILLRWEQEKRLWIFPAIGILALGGLLIGIRRRVDSVPILSSMIIVTAMFGVFLISFWPYMIPFQITIQDAASPPESLRFMFWGAGLFAFPLTLAYTALSFRAFSGKILESGGYP